MIDAKALELFVEAGRAAEGATMTDKSPNRMIHIRITRHYVAVEGRDTAKGGGPRYGKDALVSWREVVDSETNAIVRAVERVCAHLDQATGLTLV